MLRHASYPDRQMASTTQRYSGTSSAFSASANPNEDWTKISDLAERRRIQNRIAQRNYRKKLKKRLEDLERRAGSSSASPEQKPAELARTKSGRSSISSTSPESRKNSIESTRRRTSSASSASSIAQSTSYFANTEERSMFSHQYTRQLSTSPPPFSYPSYAQESTAYMAPYAVPTYAPVSATQADSLPVFAPYLPPLSSAGSYSTSLPTLSAPYAPTKPEYFPEEEMNPFLMSYASMAGIDIPQAQSYQDNSNLHTPPPSVSFEPSTSASPAVRTQIFLPPASMPPTPPLRT